MKKAEICGFALILITLLVSLASSNSVSSASIMSTVTVSSAGTVQYPVQPPVQPAKNWATIPENWRIGESWCAPSYLDYAVLHNIYPSIRLEKGPDSTKSREILCQDITQNDLTIRVKPGDHIVFRVWMKTSASSLGCTHPNSGVRIGIDFNQGQGLYITGASTPDGLAWTKENGFPANQYLNYVNWGHDWEQRTMDFIVQPQYQADGLYGNVAGTWMIPDRIIPWIQVWCCDDGNLDGGVAWFADAELYINP